MFFRFIQFGPYPYLEQTVRACQCRGYDPHTNPMESVFMSIPVELEKEIAAKEDRLTGEAEYPLVR
jgi:hypothetical protein